MNEIIKEEERREQQEAEGLESQSSLVGAVLKVTGYVPLILAER